MTQSRPTTPGGEHRGGAAAPPTAARPRLVSRRAGRALMAGSLAFAAATGGILVPQTAGAAVGDVPAFPDNIVVFPDRDFVSVEGYSDHAGETATIEVTRGSQVIGSAKAKVDGSGVAFEINHPGGFCWGADTTLKVTPDIKAGDQVKVTFPDGTGGTTTTGGGSASDAVQDGTKVTVTGTLGADIPVPADPTQTQIEQRIINPDMVPVIGKRDVRAIPGPLTPAPKGGYQSGLEIGPANADGSHPFTATYVFDTQQAADLAANAPLGERLMSWQVQDEAANRQGLTIAEFGEGGGPGMGGCPLGPGDATPAAGSAFVALSADKKSASVKWSPTESAPTASPVVNYTVTAVNKSAAADGRQLLVGSQYPATATSGTVDALDPAATYDFQVRAVTKDGKSSTPFTVGTSAGTAPQTPGTQPQLTLSPAPAADPDTVVTATAGKVTATTDAGSTIWYTLGTSSTNNPVVAGGSIVDAALPFPAEGLTIDKQVTVHVAALNKDNLIETSSGTYAPGVVATAPAAPAPKVTSSQATATVTWVPVAGETYTVSTLKSDGATPPVFTAVGSPATATSPYTASNLTKGTYGFVVTATNAAGSTASAQVNVDVTGVVDRVTITTARWKAGDFRVVGTASNYPGSAAGVTATVQVRRALAAGGPDMTAAGLIGNAAVTAPVAPATVGDYDARFRGNAAPATNPRTIYVTTANGGVAGPFTVTG